MTTLVPFGRTGIKVSRLGLGTSHIASLTNPHRPSDMARFLEVAYDQGIRFFDTADVYGQGDAERLLAGIASKPDVVICTKAGLSVGKAQPIIRMAKPFLRPLVAKSRGLKDQTSDMRQAKERHDLDQSTLHQRLLASLKRLKRDQVDVFLLHSPPLAALTDGRLYDLLDQMKMQGQAKIVGVSVQSLEDAKHVVSSGRVDVIQLPLSPASLAKADHTLRAATQQGVAVIAREILSGANDPAAAISKMLSSPGVDVNLVGTTSMQHLAVNTALMRSVVDAS